MISLRVTSDTCSGCWPGLYLILALVVGQASIYLALHWFCQVGRLLCLVLPVSLLVKILFYVLICYFCWLSLDFFGPENTKAKYFVL